MFDELFKRAGLNPDEMKPYLDYLDSQTQMEKEINLKSMEWILNHNQILPDLFRMWPFDKMVSIEWVNFLKEEQDRINKIDLKDITLINDKKIKKLSHKEIEELRFTGLSTFYVLANCLDKKEDV